MWGRNITGWDWKNRKVVGWWTPRPQVGDRILLRMTSGQIGEFEVATIEYCSD